ncbi:hypothetical protein [Ferruginibacter sp.]
MTYRLSARLLPALLAISLLLANCKTPASGSAEQVSYLDFPDTLSPVTPYDVDTLLEKKLLDSNKLPEAQRIFDILSWQMFISLNWPVDEHGKPMPEISDTGHRVWEKWKESYEIFREDGSRPQGWASATELPEELQSKMKGKEDAEVLFRTSKFPAFEEDKWKRTGKGRSVNMPEDEVDQAFTAPIWDQNGNIIRYEIRLNKLGVDYIISNELYNLDGQISFSKMGKTVSFPSGSRKTEGVIELKFAWKIIVPGKDFEERYFTKPAWVLNTKGELEKVTVGLVGMHIAAKTSSSPQWIWATFEQVDNVETNLLEQVHGKSLRPSFYDPECLTCPVNVLPDSTLKPLKSQIMRVLPIPGMTQELNHQVQALLKKKNSYWQYYQLIGTQWPTDPSAPAYPLNATVYKLPDAVTNKSGGKPVPTFLTNMVMETYFQGGTIVGATKATSYYNKYIANEPAFFQIEGGPQNVDTANTRRLIFGTEGCVNCHSSASIAVGDTVVDGVRTPKFGWPRTADFEWLLQRKAHFKTTASIINK